VDPSSRIACGRVTVPEDRDAFAAAWRRVTAAAGDQAWAAAGPMKIFTLHNAHYRRCTGQRALVSLLVFFP